MAMAMIGLGLIAQKKWRPARGVRQYSQRDGGAADRRRLFAAGAGVAAGRDAGRGASDLDGVARLSPNLAEAQKEAESLLSGK